MVTKERRKFPPGATKYHRLTNANRIGIVRKVLPRRRSFDDITDKEMRRIDR